MRERWRGGEELGAILEDEGFRLDLQSIAPVARWATPKVQPIRFDARFFVMGLPAGQVGSHDEIENLEGFWSRPAKILERFEHAEIDLVPPTQWMLNMLSDYKYIDDVLVFAQRQRLRMVCPEYSYQGPTVRLVLPGHPDHSEPVRCLEGPTSFDLQGGRFALNTKS